MRSRTEGMGKGASRLWVGRFLFPWTLGFGVVVAACSSLSESNITRRTVVKAGDAGTTTVLKECPYRGLEPLPPFAGQDEPGTVPRSDDRLSCGSCVLQNCTEWVSNAWGTTLMEIGGPCQTYGTCLCNCPTRGTPADIQRCWESCSQQRDTACKKALSNERLCAREACEERCAAYIQASGEFSGADGGAPVPR